MNILLTGSRSFVAVDLIHDLHAQKHCIYTADSVSFDYARFSRFVRKSFVTPSVRFDEKSYIDQIIEITKKYAIKQIIPLGEEALYMARNIKQITQSCPDVFIYTGSFEQLEKLHNKYSFYETVHKLGIQTPETILVHSAEEVVAHQTNQSPRIVLKPLYSRFAEQLVVLLSIDRKRLQDIDWNTPYILQKYIDGRAISSYSYSNTSQVIGYTSKLSATMPSAMTNAVKITPPSEIEEADRTIRKVLGYSTQLGLDFIQNDQGVFLLEANPRSTLGYSLISRNEAQSRMLMFHFLLGGMIARKNLSRFVLTFLTYPDVLFRWSDPLPALASQLGGLKDYIHFRKKHPGKDLRYYTSYDMQYDGEPYQYTVEEAKPSDSRQLLSLLEQLPIKGPVSAIYTRRPDAYNSLHSDGEQARIGLIKDSSGDLAFMGACTVNRYYLDGKPRSIGYISDFRKNPNFPYKINWLEMLVHEYRKTNQNLFFCSIMKNNKHAIEVFTKKRSYLPEPQLIARYNLFVVNPKKINSAPRVDEIQIVQLFRTSQEVQQQALDFIQREAPKYDLFPAIADFDDNHFGIRPSNSYVLIRDSAVVGFANLNDNRDKKQFIVQKYAWYIRPVMALNPLLRFLDLMPIPEINKPIDCPAISTVIVKDDDKILYETLIRLMSVQVLKQKHDKFMIAITEGSWHEKLFMTPYNFKIQNNLYLIDFSDEKLKVNHIRTEASVLF